MIITELGHFCLCFDNGYTISCFNGFGSYTENNFNIERQKEIEKEGNIYASWKSEHIEIAIMYENKFVTRNILHNNDDVKTVTLNELVKIINKVSKLKKFRR